MTDRPRGPAAAAAPADLQLETWGLFRDIQSYFRQFGFLDLSTHASFTYDVVMRSAVRDESNSSGVPPQPQQQEQQQQQQ